MHDERENQQTDGEMPARSPTSRPTIGVLIDSIWGRGEYQPALWAGLADAARERDANLIGFAGGRLRDPAGFESQRNAIYDLVTADSVDGLVIGSGSIGSSVTVESFRSFMDHYRPLPMVSIAKSVAGVPSVLVDNEKGMRDLIVHLIEVHGYRRIAFIRGPEDNEEAEQRYRAFTDVLSEYGLSLDPNLVTFGNFQRPAGIEAVRLLLDQRKAVFEAMVAANDEMALGVLEALQERGIRVPYDLAVVGFDNVQETQTVSPSLTTVKQPIYEQGKLATVTLLALLAGQEVPERVSLPTEVVVRQSCGCLAPAVVQAGVGPVTRTGEPFEVAFAARREMILSEMVQAVGHSPAGFVSERAEQILDAFSAELEEESPATFVRTLDDALRQEIAAGGDVAAWQGALSALRRHVLPCFDNGETSSRAEDLWQQARLMIGELAQQAQAYWRFQAERQAAALRELGQAMSTTFEVTGLMDMAARELPRVGIPSCYLALYEGQEMPPEWSRLILAYDEKGRVELEAGGQRFPSRQLVPASLWPRERRYTMVVEPLYFQDEQLGFALFEVMPREGMVCETLRGQLSSALKGVLLSQERKQGEEILARERNLLHTLIDNLPDYIYVKDTEGRFVIGNAAVIRQMGLAALDELVGKTDFDFFPRELAERYYADEQAITRSGQALYDHEGPTVDAGRERWVSTNKVPLRDAQGNIFGFVGLGRDITERKAAETERERLLAALERRAVQLQTGAEVSRAASSILDPDALIQQVVNLARERFDLYYAGLFLVDQTGEWTGEPGKWAVLRAGTGEAGRQMVASGHKLEIGGGSMIGWCVANKQARIALDVGAEPVRFENPLLPETRSELALPLISRGRVTGAMTVQSTQEAAFSTEDIAVLQTMADQLANAIANARLYAALAREQSLMNALMDNMPDTIYFKDTASRFTRVNPAQASMLGVTSPEEAVGKSDLDFWTPESAQAAYADEQQILRSGQPVIGRVEKIVRKEDGQMHWFSATKIPLADATGQVMGLVGISRDITDLKVAQEAAQRRAVQLHAGAEVSRAASSILDPDELIRPVVDLIRERFNLYYAGLFLVDQTGEWTGEPGRWAVLRAGTGEAGQQMLERGHRLEIGRESMIGWCVANKQARIALDVGAEAVRFDNPLLPETRSELALPLLSRGQAIGALTIQSAQESAFSQEDVAALQTMADQLANAIANARLYAALAREQSLMTALMDSSPDHIYFKDTESRFIRVSRSQAERFGLADPAQAEGKTDFDFFTEDHARPAYEDEQEIVSTGQPVLGIEEKETWPDRPDSWVSTSKMPLHDKEGKIVGTFGISSDITARKHAELALQRRALQLQTAAEVSRAISSILDPDELIRPVVDLIRERFDLYYAGLFLVDQTGEWTGEPGRWAVLRAGTGEPGQQMLEQGHKLETGGKSMIGWCVANKQARIALDVGEEAVRFDNPLLPETRSELALPLLSRGQAIGALTIQSTQESAFSEEDVAVLQTMAGQVANAIENTRLFERTQAALKDMEATHRRYLVKAWTEYMDTRAISGYEQTRAGTSPLRDEVLPEVRQAVAEQRAIVLNDSANEAEEGTATKSALVVPIVLRGQPIGALGFKEVEGMRLWSAEDVALAEAVAEQLALATDNLRLLDETQRRAAREQALSQMTAHFTRTLDMDTLLQTAVRELGQLPHVTEVSIHTALPDVLPPANEEDKDGSRLNNG